MAGDFLLQNSAMAQGKSSSNRAAFAHSLAYTSVWLLPMLVLFGGWGGGLGLLVIGASHFVIDRYSIAVLVPGLRGDMECPFWVVKCIDAGLHLACNCLAISVALA